MNAVVLAVISVLGAVDRGRKFLRYYWLVSLAFLASSKASERPCFIKKKKKVDNFLWPTCIIATHKKKRNLNL